MSDAARRDQLVAAHAAAFDGLLVATADLDVTGWATPTGCPGWDVKDQLAHTIGIEQWMLGDPRPDVEVPDLPHVLNDFGRETERDVLVRRDRAGAELRAEAEATFQRRLALLESLDPATLDEPMDGPAGRMRAMQVLRIRLFDLTCHEQDIRRAVHRLDGFGGPHVSMAVETVLRAWARLIPERIDGAHRLGVVVAGYDPVSIDLGGDGLRRGPDAIAGAAGTIRTDPAALIALGSGRTDAPPLDGLDFDGDRDLVGVFRAVAAITP